MTKRHGHGGHHHGPHHSGFHGMGFYGMGPMQRMPGMHGPQGAQGGPAHPNHWDVRGPPCDPRGPPNASFDPRMDPRFGCHMMRKGWMFGRHHRRMPIETSSSSSSSSSSDSSSDSDTKCKKKCNKRKRRHFKHWHQMRHMMSDPNWNKVQCTLCWRQIRPMAETEVLECGHLYHRMCLKELFAVSLSGEQTEVFCTQCRQQIDPELAAELQNRFNGEQATAAQTSESQHLDRDMKNLKVK